MFCGECGSKLKKGDLFCGECGAKTEQVNDNNVVVSKTNNSSSNPKKPMDKKTKIIIAVVAGVAILLFALYQLFGNMYSPKEVAKDYIEALINKNASKLYSYVEIEGDKTFVNKKAFEKLLDNDSYSVDIENYTITDVEYGDGKLTADVTVKYTSKSSTSEKTKTISLTKAKDKKLLFFDDWKIADMSSDSMVVEDYEITVPKDTTLTFASVKVDKKFIDKDESTDDLDVYILPQVFTAKTEIKAKLANGMELTKEVTPSKYYNYYKLSLSLDSLSDKTKKSLANTFKKDLETIYKAAMDKKTWDDIKSTFAKKDVDTDDLKESYTDFVEDLTTSSNTLKSIDFTKVELSSLSLNSDGELVIRAKASYKYSIEYTSYSGEVTTKDDSDYSYITFNYKMTGKTYSLVNAKNLVDYFSRY